ncbi:hypothetical protein EJ05DRAFT_481913 [Pseudovirgaria hyperparasitica]|uniref:Uncharacterized protein n=1 Tax=Pseudovirgaria hyperparasitica TaxID=470096 RepID=A0A6A6WLP4_9PEZI|nr:uncharacterized protein EJ05DRAFT_481913 [Pseudovirgaria hyperparasitica]KAF2763066.1 hypothetical protein EJ05DRAFT_481913 [Pseudovirgaria hyperparasitica]
MISQFALSRRSGVRIFILSFILFIIVKSIKEAVGGYGWIVQADTYDTGRYVTASAKQALGGGAPDVVGVSVWDGVVGDKVIVMSRTEEEDASWVEEELPDWQRMIYTTLKAKTAGSQKKNSTTLQNVLPRHKGHEAFAYLTYLISNYDTLPEIIVFLHPHKDGSSAWHVDQPLHSNPAAVRALNLTLVRERGYVNLRCNTRPNCVAGGEEMRHPRLLTREIWRSFWAGTSTPYDVMEQELKQRPTIDYAASGNYTQSFLSWLATVVSPGPKFQATYPTPPIADTAGAQFAVSRNAVRMRPKNDYVALKTWLVHVKKNDNVSGRTFEYLWHVVFGQPGVLCYDRTKCECEVFGRCP